MSITITSDWGRIGALWWVNSTLESRWYYWGQVRLGGRFSIRMQWPSDAERTQMSDIP